MLGGLRPWPKWPKPKAGPVEYWRIQIEDFLCGKKLYLPLLGTKLDIMKDEEWNLLDRQVLGVIRLTISRSVAHNVVKEKTTIVSELG